MNKLTVLILTLALALTLLAPAGAADAATSGKPVTAEDQMVRIINDERASRGLPALRVSLQQHRKAREHSQLMRDTDHLHHPADLGAEVFPDDAWAGIGENAARNRSIEGAHRALMDSPPHRKNLLGDWTHVAVGVAFDGRDIWITQRFVTIRRGHTLPMFTDMPGSAWKRETVAEGWREGVLTGCGGERVCPDQSLNRDQMASMLVRAMGRADDKQAAERFKDVPQSSVHAGAIGALASAGITLGCASDRYCPSQNVTRAATASLLVRAREWAPLPGQRFEDVGATHTHSTTVNRLAERSVTDGCSDTHYCPSRPISRVEAARLITRTFS
jgi:hypothetical protein